MFLPPCQLAWRKELRDFERGSIYMVWVCRVRANNICVQIRIPLLLPLTLSAATGFSLGRDNFVCCGFFFFCFGVFLGGKGGDCLFVFNCSILNRLKRELWKLLLFKIKNSNMRIMVLTSLEGRTE